MMSVFAIGSAAAGTVFLSRVDCVLSRGLGAGLVAFAVLLVADPAWADQTVMASDSAQVDCMASAKDLTRISLVEDEFRGAVAGELVELEDLDGQSDGRLLGGQ